MNNKSKPVEAKVKADYKSVFVVSILTIKDKIKYPARLENHLIGYYPTLKLATNTIRSKNPYLHYTQNFAFKTFEIREFVLNQYGDEERQLRVYDAAGRFYGKYQFKVFSGRDKKDYKYRLGELVQFADGMLLNVGIIVSLPPDKKRVKEIKRQFGRGNFNLDTGENCYRLLAGYGNRKHAAGGYDWHLFPVSGKIDAEVEKNLRMDYAKSDKRQWSF